MHGVDSKWAKYLLLLLLLLLGALLEVELFKKCPPLRREGTFPSHKNTRCSKPLLEIRMLKKCTPFWREAHFQVKKHEMLEPLLEVQILKKCIPLWRESTLPSQNGKGTICSNRFWRFWMLKKCMPLRRETHCQVNMVKLPHVLDHFWTLKRRFVWRKDLLLSF